jgi:HAD superfamily hydrolase (TIGR01549 family)
VEPAVEASIDGMVRAVTFDFWRTLIWEQPGDLQRFRVQRWLSVLATAGYKASGEQIADAHDRMFSIAAESWRLSVQYQVDEATDEMLTHLGLQVPSRVRDALVGSFSEAGLETPLQVAPGAEEMLPALRSAGYALGIICDVGLTPSVVLRDHLRRRGLLAHFDHCVFSDELGAYKPARAPYLVASDALGVRPEQLAHVGDQRRTDVQGARNAGAWAIRYAGVFDDRDTELPEGHLVIHTYGDLLAGLESLTGRL